eukprot:GHVU01121840.1.p1 GENE.GHVU01121840.1~~GHVU01121840.1.p1  ORF type:complete len:165 (+),score=50.07 GHVU01121840.1:172-666(+)
MDKRQLAELKSFVELISVKPQVLQNPELLFFREYLVKLGATLPEGATCEPAAAGCSEVPKQQPEKEEEKPSSSSDKEKKDEEEEDDDTEEEDESEEMPVEDEEPDTEIIPADTDEFPPMAEKGEKEFSDDEFTKLAEFKEKASEALEVHTLTLHNNRRRCRAPT